MIEFVGRIIENAPTFDALLYVTPLLSSPNLHTNFPSSPNLLTIQCFTFIFADMTDAGPSTPRRSRRHKLLMSAAASPSGPRPSRDVTTSLAAGPSKLWRYRDVTASSAAGPSEARPFKFPRLTIPVAGLSEPQPSGHHDVATSEVTRPSEPRLSTQHDPTSSDHPGVTQRKCTKCHRWRNLDQFQSKSRSHPHKITQTCLRCREGKVCISCP